MTSRLRLLAALPLLLAGCTSKVDFPSLAPRPVEGLLAKAPVETPATAITDPALEATVREQAAAADAGARGFADALAATRSAIGRPGATTPGTEAWLSAQQALTELGAARGALGGAIGELDAARLAAAGRDRPVDTTRLDAAIERLGRMAAEQDSAYDALAAQLPNG